MERRVPQGHPEYAKPIELSLRLPQMPKDLTGGKIVSASPEKVLELISQRSLRRKPAPHPDSVKTAIERGIAGGKLRFMILWGGCKETGSGVTSGADERDEAVLARLSDVFKRLSQDAKIGVEATILFCNVHAASINGRPFADTLRYLNGDEKESGLAQLAIRYGFKVQPLNEVYLRSFWRSNEAEFDRITAAAGAEGDDDFNRFLKEAGNQPMQPGAQRLTRSAQAHSVYAQASGEVDGQADPAKAAGTYVSWRKFESKLLSGRFPDSVFVAFSDPGSHELNPDSTVYWWAIRRGDGSVPWFPRIRR